MTKYMAVLAVLAVPDGTDPDTLHERIGGHELMTDAQYLQVTPVTTADAQMMLYEIGLGVDMDTAEWSDTYPPDFVVLLPPGLETPDVQDAGELAVFGSRWVNGEQLPLRDAIKLYVPGLSSQGMGRLCTWFTDNFGDDPRPNPLADLVVGRLGYQHETGWRGPVAISMEQDADGEYGPLLPEVVQIITDLAGQDADETSEKAADTTG